VSVDPLSVAHHPWSEALRRPRMANDEDVRPGLSLTSRSVVRDGTPVIPVSGEIHYSRLPRERWRERLRQMRAGGITVATSYIFWLHHVEHRGEPRFDGNLDVAAFVDLCVAEGLDVILRIGPWVHGESRNGGFPDWVQQAPVRHRTDDPGYLALVEEWFGQIGAALDGRAAHLLGIQLENELYDQPEHLVTLKRLARAAGLAAPLWTATAWGGADLPEGEVLPLYGGYGDGFWVDADAPWDPTFRDHYFFSHVWDDPGIGADLRRMHEEKLATPQPRTPSVLFPAATCELGGGMATAYHRRPRPEPLDVAAIAHCKIGNGSAWQGYYMYVGGTNPAGDHGMQESHATGYPNDMPRFGYDFRAPIGESGLLAGSHAELRRQHAFLAAFGDRLADMPSSLPDIRPAGVEDDRTLRFALRSDGDGGFLFVNWHQPHIPLPAYRKARFRVRLDDRELVFPAEPVDIPFGTIARWPIGLTVGGVRIDWATASAQTVLPGPVPTLVLVAADGVDVTYAVDGVVRPVRPGLTPERIGDGLDLLVLPASAADRIWIDEDGPRRRLLLAPDELSWGPDGRINAWTTGARPEVLVYEPARREFTELPLRPGHPGRTGPATVTLVSAGGAVPMTYAKSDGRQSAPTADTFDELAAVHRIDVPDWAADEELDTYLRIGWAGDVGRLRVDGRVVTDRFWDGAEWTVSLRDAGWRSGSAVDLHVLPLAAGSAVSLPPDARERLLTADGQLHAVDMVEVLGRAVWHELRAD
jgi:beta-galactosidase